MKIAEPKTPPRCSSDASVTAPADASTVAATAPAPAAAASAAAPAAATSKTELGFTLQTLIVTAVLVLAATGVTVGLLAVNSASSDDFEEAGKTGVYARCPAPNEVQDPELIGRGVAGVNKTFRDIKSDNIGCNPICATWEYYDPGRAAAGIGGPEGNGGVFSSNEGCFAPCYWQAKKGANTYRPDPSPSAYYFVANAGSALVYDDSNRAPGNAEVRFGVVYSETTAAGQRDQIRVSGTGREVVIYLPLNDNQRIPVGAYTHKPLLPTDGSSDRTTDPYYTNNYHGMGSHDISHFWEWHVDPKEEKCYVIDPTFPDNPTRIVCTSEQDWCVDSGYSGAPSDGGRPTAGGGRWGW